MSARLTRFDIRILLGLTTLAFVLRLFSPIMPDFLTNPTAWPPVRAWGLGHPYQSPNGYIFDEVYFAQDSCKDLVGIDYLDPEPPLAKLVIAAGIVVAGTFMHYDKGAHVAADKRCETVGTLSGYGTWGWRLTSLVFGTLLIPMIYLLALRLWPDRFFATSAALLMNFDGMSFVQSRIAMIDVVALFLLLLVYWVYHLQRDATTSRQWTRRMLLLGLCVGLAVSAKWTTLAAWGTIILFSAGTVVLRYVRVSGAGGWTWGDVSDASEPGSAAPPAARPGARPKDPMMRLALWVTVLVFIPVVVYFFSYLRYASIPHNVPNPQTPAAVAAQHNSPAPTASQSPNLPADCDFSGYITSAPAVALGRVGPVWLPTSFNFAQYVQQIYDHDRWAYKYHACLTATHPYGSPWYSWPFLLRPVAYYYQDNLGLDASGTGQLRAEVFNLGNPAIWWFSIPALIYCAMVALRERSYPAALIVVAFLAAWLPFSRVNRVMFLYHMFGALPFMMLAVAFAVARLRRLQGRIQVLSFELPAVTGTHLALGYLGLVVLLFVFFYPLWTGLPISEPAWMHRIWLNLSQDTKISWI